MTKHGAPAQYSKEPPRPTGSTRQSKLILIKKDNKKLALPNTTKNTMEPCLPQLSLIDKALDCVSYRRIQNAFTAATGLNCNPEQF